MQGLALLLPLDMYVSVVSFCQAETSACLAVTAQETFDPSLALRGCPEQWSDPRCILLEWFIVTDENPHKAFFSNAGCLEYLTEIL
jgi:hypothetical protein